MGWFSSDRTISEYATDVWGVRASIATGDISPCSPGGLDDPFRVLGLHDGPGGVIATALVIGADRVEAFSLADARAATCR